MKGLVKLALSTVLALSACIGLEQAAKAATFTGTETFREFGTRDADQDGFSWTFTDLREPAGDLTIRFNWRRMDFNSSSEYMDIFAEGTRLGRIGVNNANCFSTNGFLSDCRGSRTFSIAQADIGGLLTDGILNLTANQNSVDSSGGPGYGARFGFVRARLTYETVPEPTTMIGLLAVGGLGLATKKKLKQDT